MSVSPTVLSNNILYRSKEESIPVTPMKLQKLLYFICRDYLKNTGVELFSERFGVWKYGPVLQSVYDEFKSFGPHPITSYAKDASGRSFVVDEYKNSVLKNTIDVIWNQYKYFSGIQLSELTHLDGSGWSTAFIEGRPYITKEDMENDNI